MICIDEPEYFRLFCRMLAVTSLLYYCVYYRLQPNAIVLAKLNDIRSSTKFVNFLRSSHIIIENSERFRIVIFALCPLGEFEN